MEASRPAVPADLPRLAELVAAGTAELRGLRGGDIWAAQRLGAGPVADRLSGALADPRQRVVVATIDGVVLGYAWAVAHRLADGRLLASLDDVFVEEGARGVGLGELLVSDVEAWCRAQGCVGIDATALPGQRATKNFYEGSGFTARLLVMHRPLDPGAGEDPTGG